MASPHHIHHSRLRKKSHPVNLHRRFIELYIPIVICLSVISVFAAYLIAFVESQFAQVFETQKTEVSQIPSTVEKTLPSRPRGAIRVPILLYHYVEYVKDKGDTIRQSLDIVPHVFDEQLKTLVDANYTFLTASELADIIDGKLALPRKPILLTFDDGHWDLATDVLPILEKYHVKATAYIISGFIGGRDFMTKEQLQDVINSGLVEIGAHTVHHVALAGKLLPVVRLEVENSKSDLENEYNIPIVSFAYPGGSFDGQAINIVRNAGFRTAVSTVPGVEQSNSNRYFLFRIRPGYRVGRELLTYLEQSSFKPW